MNRIKIITVIVVVVIGILSGLSFLLPAAGSPSGSTAFHSQLFVTLLIGLTHFAAAFLFILSLHNFKAELRKAYMAICIGMVTLGISQFMYPTFAYLAVQNPVFYLFPSIIAIIADILILWGVKDFAKLLFITPKFASWPVIFTVTILLSYASTLLPHFPTPIPEKSFDLSQSLYIVSIVLLLFTSSLMFLIKRITSHAYAAATTWFIVAQLSAIFSLIFLFTINMINPVLLSWLKVPAITPLVFVGIFSMAVGYAFNTVGPYGESVNKLHNKITIIDVNVFLASLASNLKDIDTILDDMRIVTAKLKPDEKLTEEGEVKLRGTYHKLEDYLVNRESLRKFDVATIRKSVSQRFNIDPSPTSEFWQKTLS